MGNTIHSFHLRPAHQHSRAEEVRYLRVAVPKRFERGAERDREWLVVRNELASDIEIGERAGRRAG